MNVGTKTKRHFKDQDNFDKFYSAWNKLINSENLEACNFNLVELRNQKPSAVEYFGNTWLVWGVKFVKSQTNISFFN